jgi:hypothetical protein
VPLRHSTKAEAKIEENKKRMQGHGEKVSESQHPPLRSAVSIPLEIPTVPSTALRFFVSRL